MIRSRVSFAHVTSFGSNSAAERSIGGPRADGGGAGGAPAIIFVTVAFGRERSSSEGIPPVSWSDMVVTVEQRVLSSRQRADADGRWAGDAGGGGPGRRDAAGFICASI